ncbi:pyrimidine-nucleoside phosphorylase [Atopobacter sp. AH10]|uniref:pyrimidine-nucleoside phosphorylase n=1 Tax=Atopobacter sp. AH10 TaxID=2315861 RepID=UPI000EF1EB33|nr:pyrimidine-nucleoside phosphorylase [Atopobacter sp. AH10]RLK62665.1 pyrimidine-nucleoside phosphorylase [Atopobacter sp. AH10]
MDMVALIEKKRDGKVLSEEEIKQLIEAYTKGSIPDYQMSAWLMAVYIRGMTEEEVTALTLAMMHSGDQLDLSSIKGIKVDKHSTGGVGDTTSLILGPLVASLGLPVAKMSGRGLGHTGGTIDKLEAIPGFHVDLSEEDFKEQVNRDGLAIIGQTGEITPADKKIYALRDVTGTVGSLPLIAASIMSKKLAAGSDAICLDVKVGSGAFMKTSEEAEKLAETMVAIGHRAGRRTMAVISDMSQPLGRAIGNALEVEEAIETLQGRGPDDLTELVLTLASQMLLMGEKAKDLSQARSMLIEQLKNGQAYASFKTFVKDQGGIAELCDSYHQLIKVKEKRDVLSPKAGFIMSMDAEHIGLQAMHLGAGRAKKEEKIDPYVGLVLHRKIGDWVNVGDRLCTIYSNHHEENIETIEEEILASLSIGPELRVPALIHGVVGDAFSGKTSKV